MAGRNRYRDAVGMRGRKRTPLRVDLLETRQMLSATIAEYPTSGATGSVVAGPDGNIWFTEAASGGTTQIVVFNPTTQASTTIPFAGNAITAGPDGNIWSIGADSLAKIDPATHAITTIPLPSGVSDGTVIAPGPGNDVAFVVSGFDIGLIDTTTDAITIDPSGVNSGGFDTAGIQGLAAGPDGNLWFAYGASTFVFRGVFFAGDIGILNPTTGSVSTIPLEQTAAWGIAAGPDGNMYFTAFGDLPSSLIGSVNPTTHAVTENAIPGPGTARGIALGPDGNLWFAEVGPGAIGTFAPSTRMFSVYTPPSASSAPFDIASGPGNTLWFTDIGTSAIGVVQLGTPPPSGSVAVSGSVYVDANVNSTFGPGDSPLAGHTVYLDLGGDGRLDPGDPSAVTDADGRFTLTAPATGTFTLRVATYPGDVATGPVGGGYTVTLAAGTSPIVNIGLVQGSSIAPLNPTPSPFGSNPPNLHEAELTALYRTILGRAPDAPGFAFWEGALASGMSVQQVASSFLDSPEYESDVVGSYYTNFLGRAASPAELSSWVSYIQASGTSLEGVADLFLTGPEYNARHAGDADFIQSLYGNMLGRQGSASEVAAWESFLTGGGTRAQMVQVAIQAGDTRAVEGDYGAVLGRPAEPAGLDAALKALQSGVSLVDLDAFFFGSVEFASRAAQAVAS